MRAPANVAFVNPTILSWARARSGLSHLQLEKVIKASSEELVAWERGDSNPPFDKAQKIAKAFRIPFGYLFLSTPPELTLPLPDMRTQSDRHPLSLDFLELVNDALVKQDWYRDYLQESKSPKLKFGGMFTTKDDFESVAEDIRRVIGINVAFR
jgi:transcriptional regulator with XRE-family HTH domain